MVEDKKIKWVYRFVILLLIFLSCYVFMKIAPIWLPILSVIKTLLLPFIISGFITYLLHPIVERIHGQGIPRSLAILLIYLLFFGGIGFAIYKGIPTIIGQIRELAESYPEFMETYRNWLYNIEAKTSSLPVGIHTRIDEFFISVEQYLDSFLSKTLLVIKGFFNSLFLLAIIPFIVFYMLKDYDQMKKAIWYMTPRKFRQSGQLFLRDVDESLGSYIRGQLVVCTLIGCLSSFGFWIAGMKFPLLLGIIIGITNIIPYFGPLIGAIPAAIIAATLSIKLLIIVVLIVFVLQFIEGNLLSPLIVGKSLHMHPIVIMAALLLGGEIAGVVGLIIAVPVVAILKVLVIHTKLHFMQN